MAETASSGNATEIVFASAAPSAWSADSSTTITQLTSIGDVGANATAQDPQSKLWQRGGVWWGVLDTNSGTSLFRLDGTSWTQVIFLSGSFYNADVLPVGNGDVVYALLHSGSNARLAKFTFSGGTYQLSPLINPSTPLAPVPLTAGSDTATITLDGAGRMWMAQDTTNTIEVRYADSPYTSWSSPVTLATTSSAERELSAIVAFDGKVGVLWSNHATQRFGFRYHVDGTSPTSFSADEVPASQSALAAGSGMADDHLNIKVGADGTLYAAVKTAYDLTNQTYPEMALLVRRPNGAWDPLYGIDAHGTRPIVQINNSDQFLRYIYASSTGVGDILFKDIPFAELDPANPNKFYSGQDLPSALYPPLPLIPSGLSKHAASTRQSFDGDLVVIATNASTATDLGPYSISSARMSDPAQALNQPPVNSVPGTQTVLEDATRVFSTANGNAISIADPDGGSGNERVILTITGGTASIGTTNLTVIGNGTNYVAATGTLANINAALNGLVFTPTANLFGTAAANIRLDTSDLASSGAGGPRTDSDNIVIHLTSVNDAPSFTKGGADSVLEDSGTRTIVNWATNIKSGPTNEAAQTLTFVVTNSNNSLFSVQPALSAGGTLTYTPAANANGAATINVYLQDNGGTANGGVNVSPTINFTISITAINDAPSFVKGTDVTVLETSATQYFPGWATSISAGPANEASQSLTFTLVNDNNALFTTQPKVDADGRLSFKPATNAYGVANVTISMKDNGGTANGGIDTTSTQSFVITVVNINDEPSFTKGADQTILEDAGPQSVALWATAISAGPMESQQTLTFFASSNNAALFAVQPSITTAGTLSYTPAANANGVATVSVYLQDNGGAANGGDDTSSTKTFKITVTSVNDAPSFTKGANQSVPLNAPPQTVTNWATNIIPGPADEAAQSLTFTVTNNNSGLFSSAPDVSASGTLTYTLASGATGSATVSLYLADSGGTLNGGSNVSPTQTFTIGVTTSPNQPPVNAVPGTQSTLEDTPRVFSVANGNGIAINDPDAGAGIVQVTLTSVNGTVSINTSGLSVTGNGTPQVVASGTLSALNAALDGLSFLPANDFNGSGASLTVLTDDLGNTGSGGNLTDSDTIAISITSVNDAPSFVKGADQSVASNSGLQTVSNWATSIGAGASNESTQTLNFIVGNDNTALFSTQPAVGANGTLTFTPAIGAAGSAIVSVSLHDNGGTANGGQDTSAVQTFTISIGSSNSAPVLNNSGAASLDAVPSGAASNGGTLVSQIIASVLPLQMITDADPGAVQGIAVTAVDAAQGLWEYSLNGSVWQPMLGQAGLSRLLAADATTRVRFVPDATFAGTVANGITFRAWDRTAGSNGALVDTSVNGGSSAFSISQETAAILVTSAYAVRAGQESSTLPSDEGRGIVVDSSGNAFVTGTLFYADGVSDSSSTNSGDVFVSRFDASGTQIWQVTVGSTGDDRGRAIARDASGNVYVTGLFQGSVDFDPGTGTTVLTSQGGFDIFVLKLNANGVFQWAKSFGSNASNVEAGQGITIDSSGSVLVAGQFAGTVDFGTAPALTSAGSADVFILKLSPNNGSTTWAKRVGGSGIDSGNAITTDAAGQIYLTGSFRSTTDFDPGVGVYNLQSNGNDDAFVLRLTSAGNFSMAVSMGGSTSDEGNAIAVDVAGNIFTTGDFSGSGDFDPGAGTTTLTSNGGPDVYVSKLSPSGSFVFAKQMGGTGDDRARGLAVLNDGSLAITGHYTDSADFDPSGATATLTSAGSNDSFVWRLSSSGAYIAARSLGGTAADLGRAIAVDQYDDLYLTGQFSATMSVDTGAGVFNLTSVKGKDVYVVKLHPALSSTGGGGGGAFMAQSVPAAQVGVQSQSVLSTETSPFDPLIMDKALRANSSFAPTSFASSNASHCGLSAEGQTAAFDAVKHARTQAAFAPAGSVMHARSAADAAFASVIARESLASQLADQAIADEDWSEAIRDEMRFEQS